MPPSELSSVFAPALKRISPRLTPSTESAIDAPTALTTSSRLMSAGASGAWYQLR